MKRSFYLLLIMVVATIASCTKPTNDFEDERLNPASTTYTYTVTANNSEPATKSDYNSDGSFKWSAGDAISVLFHNNDAEVKNKFFTLTLVSGANSNSATFSGEIDNGYTIGASDGTESDKKIWALFPASDNHAYAEGSNPSFYVQPSVDFTTSHFSANIPMCALNQEEGALSFENLASTYKFTVTGIKEGVDKVKFTVYNQTTFGLSGLWPIADDGKLIVNYGYASPGSEKSTLTYISNVVNNQAVFYVSCHGTYGDFKPVITVTNCATDVPIKTFTSTKADKQNSVSSIKPITLKVSEADGGDYFTPAITIDGGFTDWASIEGVTNGNHTVKVTSDKRNIYFYSHRTTAGRYSEIWSGSGYIYFGFNIDNDSTNDVSLNDNGPYDYIGFIHPYKEAYEVGIAGSGDCRPESYTVDNVSCAGTGNATDGVTVEFSIPRTDLPTIPTTSITITSWGNKDLSRVTLNLIL